MPDGNHDLVDISNKINVSVQELYPIVEKLLKADLLSFLGKKINLLIFLTNFYLLYILYDLEWIVMEAL